MNRLSKGSKITRRITNALVFKALKEICDEAARLKPAACEDDPQAALDTLVLKVLNVARVALSDLYNERRSVEYKPSSGNDETESALVALALSTTDDEIRDTYLRYKLGVPSELKPQGE